MAKKKRRNPPSRVKYDRDNPVVSFRVKRKDKDRFIAIREKLGMSNGDVYKAGLGVIEVKVRAEAEIRQEGYEEGQLSGYELAESEYKVTYPCSICGKSIEVTTDKEKEAIAKYMVEHGWAHGDCLNR
jgi:hypothetical protein